SSQVQAAYERFVDSRRRVVQYSPNQPPTMGSNIWELAARFELHRANCSYESRKDAQRLQVSICVIKAIGMPNPVVLSVAQSQVEASITSASVRSRPLCTQ